MIPSFSRSIAPSDRVMFIIRTISSLLCVAPALSGILIIMIPRTNISIIIINFFGLLKISFKAIKRGTGIAPARLIERTPVRPELSPSEPERIAVTGDILRIRPV